MEADYAHQTFDTIDAERARLFGLLGRLLAGAPDAALIAAIRGLPGGRTPLGEALGALATAARGIDAARTKREYFDLFIGVGRGELLPYASWYLTGFLHERPLAAVRAELARLGIGRGEAVAEPEDHIGFLCEAFAGLIEGRFPAPPEAADRFFAQHVLPWADRFFAELEVAEAARFYRAVGRLGRTAIEIEAAAQALPA